MYKIGIIGCGFVGSAVAAGFSLKADVKIYDKFKEGFDSVEEVCGQDILFLCLPTPMRMSDGKPDESFLDEAIQLIAQTTDQEKILVIKSTVLPGTNRKLQEAYPQFIFISNPEFLTARSARLDFINASRIIIGGKDFDVTERMFNLYRTVFLHTPIYRCSWEEAEITKYMANCFFALKISYLNEIYDICKINNCNYDFVKLMWLSDGRIGNSHHEVPGHDGDRGFGGTCFPKDIAAFTSWAEEQGYPIETLTAAKNVNQRIRKNQNWETSNN
jgi:UDPglucose 6-dehydrogenase